MTQLSSWLGQQLVLPYVQASLAPGWAVMTLTGCQADVFMSSRPVWVESLGDQNCLVIYSWVLLSLGTMTEGKRACPESGFAKERLLCHFVFSLF